MKVDDNPVSLSSDYEGSGSSPFIRTKSHTSLESNFLVTSHSAPFIINVHDDS